MKTYIFTWNSNLYREGKGDFAEDVERIAKTGIALSRWSCTSKTEKDSRIFLYHSGDENKGIFGSGYTVSDVFRDEHWNSKAKHKETSYIKFIIDKLVYPLDSRIIPLEKLKKIPDFYVPMQSGVEINENAAKSIEQLWENVKQDNGVYLPTEMVESLLLPEGSILKRHVNSYERNPQAREKCIEYHGCQCQICGFDFEAVYGPTGKDVIEVHHVVPLSKIKKGYEVNPVNDLLPVCPNCHTILHRKGEGEVFSPEEVREMIKVPIFDFNAR